MTVNFSCSHCKSLMAVGLNLLGRNVRCPTCKQVVQAPATAPTPVPATPLPATTVPPKPPKQPEIDLFPATTAPTDEPESIFGEQHDDDLFGTRAPKVELPASPPTAPAPTVEPQPVPANSWVHTTPAPLPPPFEPLVQPSTEATPPVLDEWPTGAAVKTPSLPSSKMTAVKVSSRTPAPGGNSSAFIWILLVYAAIATGGAGYLLYLNMTAEKQPETAAPPQTLSFKSLPDVYGQYERADRKKIAAMEGMPPIDAEVPAELRVKLGQPLSLGQLEITPVKIERQNVLRYRQEKGKPAAATKETPHPVYVLRMKLKNLSKDVFFRPNDPAFNRRHSITSAPGTIAPYNAVIVDNVRFSGGPFNWPFPGSLEREFIEGQQEDGQDLAPKQEREFIICTDYDPGLKLEPAIQKHRADAATQDKPLLWRVQLRTGLQTEADSQGKEREIPITSVFEVQFMAQDVK